MVFRLMILKGFFLHVESCKWCTELLVMAYTNQKAVSSYILLRVELQATQHIGWVSRFWS